MPIPLLTTARAPLTHRINAANESGALEDIAIPAERSLTVYIDKREVVTLMTLGVNPELLVLGFLLNQRLVKSAADIESITVDWDAGDCVSTSDADADFAGVAAVKTRNGIADLEAKTAKKTVTTGCGQGSVFGSLLDDLDTISIPRASLQQVALYEVVNQIRVQDTTYKSSGSVHGCALFEIDGAAAKLLHHVEDVGRHNALDTIAGWNAMAQPVRTEPVEVPVASRSAANQAQDQRRSTFRLLYTTGRLTSEMVIKAAQMGVPFVVSRSGITHMGYLMAKRVGLCTIGRALNKHYLCYTNQTHIAL